MNHAASTPAFSGHLASLLWPASTASFFDDCWQRRPLHVPHSDPDYFTGLFSLDDIDDHLRFSVPLEDGKLRLGIKGVAVPEDELWDSETPGFNYERVRSFCNAVSLTLNYLQQDNIRVRWMAGRLQRDFAGRLRQAVNVNAYLTPGRSWLGVHCDTHDEINLQVLGSKRWRIYEPDIRVPVPEMPISAAPPGTLPAPCMEVDLRQGEVLYVPRGFWHDPVNAEEGPSLGLTIGLTSMTWSDVLVSAIRLAAASSAGLRESVPLAQASDASATARQLCDGLKEWAAMPAAREAVQQGLVGEDLGEMTFTPWPLLFADSWLRPVRASTWRLDAIGGLLRLEVAGRRIGLRRELREALHAIRQRDEFTPSQLGTALNENERLRFCRLLQRFGAVECA